MNVLLFPPCQWRLDDVGKVMVYIIDHFHGVHLFVHLMHDHHHFVVIVGNKK